jgi:hypothetical protein
MSFFITHPIILHELFLIKREKVITSIIQHI